MRNAEIMMIKMARELQSIDLLPFLLLCHKNSKYQYIKNIPKVIFSSIVLNQFLIPSIFSDVIETKEWFSSSGSSSSSSGTKKKSEKQSQQANQRLINSNKKRIKNKTTQYTSYVCALYPFSKGTLIKDIWNEKKSSITNSISSNDWNKTTNKRYTDLINYNKKDDNNDDDSHVVLYDDNHGPYDTFAAASNNETTLNQSLSTHFTITSLILNHINKCNNSANNNNNLNNKNSKNNNNSENSKNSKNSKNSNNLNNNNINSNNINSNNNLNNNNLNKKDNIFSNSIKKYNLLYNYFQYKKCNH